MVTVVTDSKRIPKRLLNEFLEGLNKDELRIKTFRISAIEIEKFG